MAFIAYVPTDAQAPQDRVDDADHIIQIHSVNPAVMRQHLELYRQLMHRSGPLSRREREMLALRVSALNKCRY
jgi:alkylhydroperoxidase family enzyme